MTKLFALPLIILAVSVASPAQVPDSLSYQGYLTDDSGVPVNGTRDMTFKFYRRGTTTIVRAVNVSGVAVSNGIFKVGIDVTGLAFNRPYDLGLFIAGEEMTPRTPLESVPYAKIAETVSVPLALSGYTTDPNEGVIWLRDQGNPEYAGSAIHIDEATVGLKVKDSIVGVLVSDAEYCGIEVNSKNGSGLVAGHIGTDGFGISSPIQSGIEVRYSVGHGVFVGNVEDTGLKIYQAGTDGILVERAGAWAANFIGDVRIGEGEDSGVQDASLYIEGDSDGSHPHLHLKELSTTGFARFRFENENPSGYVWDIGAGTTDLANFNFYTRGVDVVTVWPDGVGTDLISTSAGGARLTQGGAWTNGSGRDIKTDFEPVDLQYILDRLAILPVDTWRYKVESQDIRHLGPIAEDFSDLFGLGDNDTTIGTVDADGVALAAIKGLYQIVQGQNARIEDLEERLAALER